MTPTLNVFALCALGVATGACRRGAPVRREPRGDGGVVVAADASASATFEYRVRPRELFRNGAREGLGSYVKYNQLLAVRFYADNASMCPQDAAVERPRIEDLRAVGREVTRSAQETVDRVRRARAGFQNVTSLHVAAFLCHDAGVAELLPRGAGVDARDRDGFTPLHYANCALVARRLLDGGASVRETSATGLTPLHLAVDRDVARLLVARGADVRARDRCGNTPLHLAAYFGLRFTSVAGAATRQADASVEAPTWVRVLARAIDGVSELIGYIAERFNVYGALEASGASGGEPNLCGTLADVTSPGEGGDWD